MVTKLPKEEIQERVNSYLDERDLNEISRGDIINIINYVKSVKAPAR